MKNLFKRLVKNPYSQRAELEEWSPDELLRGGYRMVMNPLLGGYADGFDRSAEYLFLRRTWAEPQRFRLSDQDDLFNIAGLYWRPV